VHKTYTATLSLGPQGEVQEMGDVAAVFDRDRLLAHRKRCIGFGIFFALVTVFMTIAEVVAVVQATSGKLAVGLVGAFLFVLLPAAITFLLFRASRKTAGTLGMPTAEWWRI